jgi:hypothetical protein
LSKIAVDFREPVTDFLPVIMVEIEVSKRGTSLRGSLVESNKEGAPLFPALREVSLVDDIHNKE